MKRKYATMALSLLAMLSLAGCGSGKTDDNTAISENVNGSLSFSEESYEVERNAEITVRVNTTKLNLDNRTVTFSCSDADAKYIKLPDNTSGLLSVTIKGLRIGTATLTATADGDDTISATVQIKVVPVKNSLRKVWKQINTLSNYTVKTYDVDVSEEEPVSVMKLTDNAVTITDGDGESIVKLGSYADDGETIIYYQGYGIALDENGYGYYLMKNEAGSEWVTPTVSLKGGAGLLKKNNFSGAAEKATSYSDTNTSFFSLKAINSDWLTSTKDSSNTYEITGTKDDMDSTYVEVLLWTMMDPQAKEQFIEDAGGEALLVDIAAAVDTTITVVDNSTISVSIYDNVNNKNLVAYMSDVGTTTLDDEVQTYLNTGSVNVELPALASDLTLLKEAVLKNNYAIYENMTYGKYYSYYTPTFYWNGILQEHIDAYTSGTLTSDGYAVTKAGIYKFQINWTAVTDEATNTTTYTPTLVWGSRYSTSTDLPGEGVETSSEVVKYFSSAECFQEKDNDSLYTFTYYSYQGATGYYSQNETIGYDLSYCYFGGYDIKELVEYMYQYYGSEQYLWNYYYTQYEPTKAKDSDGNTYVSSCELFFGSFGGGYGYTAQIYFDYESNSYLEYIQQQIDLKNASL